MIWKNFWSDISDMKGRPVVGSLLREILFQMA